MQEKNSFPLFMGCAAGTWKKAALIQPRSRGFPRIGLGPPFTAGVESPSD
jgi:hypothetical protein